MVAPVGPTSLTWRHGPTSGSLSVGPTIMTWRPSPSGGSNRHDMASWSHRWVPPCWRVQPSWHGTVVPSMGPTLLTWQQESAVRSSPLVFILFGKNSSSFYFIWQKNLLHRSLDPKPYYCNHKWVTTRLLTCLCYNLVCFFICLVIKPNSIFYFPKKIKKILHKKVWTYNLSV